MTPRIRQIYIIRHAIAEPRGPAWRDDSRRPLSTEGTARFRSSVRALLALDVEPDLILTSPLLRTRQTAELLAEAFEPPPPITLTDALRPGAPLDAVIADLDRHHRHLQIAVVGHEPGIGAVAAKLLGFAKPIPFKKGAVARIDVTGTAAAQEGTLRWFLPPGVLRRLKTRG